MPGLKSLMILPKYIGYLIVFSILANYQIDPKYMDWKWWLIITVSFFNIIMIIWNRYQNGFDAKIIVDIFWLLIYITIIYMYIIKFTSKDEIYERLKKTPGEFLKKVATFISVLTGIVITLCVLIIILFVCQFIPIVDVVAIPAVNILSFIL